MPKFTTRDVAGIASEVRAGRPFDTHGALFGVVRRSFDFGQLPTEFHSDVKLADYVIMSYGTPIAWRTGSVWTCPLTKYSATTSRHQSTIRQAIDRATAPLFEVVASGYVKV